MKNNKKKMIEKTALSSRGELLKSFLQILFVWNIEIKTILTKCVLKSHWNEFISDHQPVSGQWTIMVFVYLQRKPLLYFFLLYVLTAIGNLGFLSERTHTAHFTYVIIISNFTVRAHTAYICTVSGVIGYFTI